LASNPFDIASRSDIFHIPFEKRQYATVARYSIPGFPSLYLGRSVYACWEEMKRPSFDNLYVSRFNFAKATRILRLDYDPYDLLREIHEIHYDNSDFQKNLKTFLSLWPLQLSCSIPTRCNNASFYPEYIIPQMLMQWIRNKDIAGICYRTTRVPLKYKVKFTFDNRQYPPVYPLILNNYVFPVKSNQSKGYCSELSKLFQCTDPILWGVLESSSFVRPDDQKQLLNALNFHLAPNVKIPYAQSVFGKCQLNLLSKTFQAGEIR